MSEKWGFIHNDEPSMTMTQCMGEEECKSRYQNAYMFDNILTIMGFKRTNGKLNVYLYHNRDCKSSLWYAEVSFKVTLQWDNKNKTLFDDYCRLSTEQNYIMLEFCEELLSNLETSDLCISCVFEEYKGMRPLPSYQVNQPHSREHMRFKFRDQWVSVNKTILDMESTGFSSRIPPESVVSYFKNSSIFKLFLCFLFNCQVHCRYSSVHLKACINFAANHCMRNVVSRIERFLCLRSTMHPHLKLLLASNFTLRNLEKAALEEITSVEYCKQLMPIISKLRDGVLRNVVRRLEILHCQGLLRDTDLMRERREMVYDTKKETDTTVRSCESCHDDPFPRWEEVITNTGYSRKPAVRIKVYPVKPEDSLKPITHVFPINRCLSNMWSKKIIYHLTVFRDEETDFTKTIHIDHYHEDVEMTETIPEGHKIRPAKKYVTKEETVSQNACWWEGYDGDQPEWPDEEDEEFVTITVNKKDVVFHKKKLLYHSAEFRPFLECESISLPPDMTLNDFMIFFHFAYIDSPDSYRLINDANIENITEVATWFRAHRVIESVQKRLAISPVPFSDKFKFLLFGQRFGLPAVQATFMNPLDTIQQIFEALEDIDEINRATMQCVISHLAMLTTEQDFELRQELLEEQLMEAIDAAYYF